VRKDVAAVRRCYRLLLWLTTHISLIEILHGVVLEFGSQQLVSEDPSFRVVIA
jgi:uncharacterized membrane protein